VGNAAGKWAAGNRSFVNCAMDAVGQQGGARWLTGWNTRPFRMIDLGSAFR
jgi:hypothetical protein